MKLFKTVIIAVLLTMLISACGAEPIPTISAEQVAATAQAAAQTMVAQTLAAVPTATLPPPTDTPTVTPIVTDTPLVPPTLEVLSSPTTAPAASDPNADPCATRVLGSSLKGRPTTIRIANLTGRPITVSIYLNETASHGECGYRAYNLAKNGDVVLRDVVQGCYYLWAWSTGGKNFNSEGYGCINNDDKWTFEVGTNVIKFVGP